MPTNQAAEGKLLYLLFPASVAVSTPVAASQRSTTVAVIPCDSCQLLGLQSAEPECLGSQIPTGLGTLSGLACGTRAPGYIK